MLKSIIAFLKRLFGVKPATVETPEYGGFSGWVSDVHDPRDIIYEDDNLTKTKTRSSVATPAMVDLRSRFRTPIENQASTNSCVGHASTAAAEAIFMSQTDLSRLFVYWNSRSYEGTTGSDAGTQIRNAMKSISVFGIASESAWPYDTTKVTTKPSSTAYSNGLPFKNSIATYTRVTTLAGLKDALQKGRPVVFGFSVTQKFVSETRTTGILPYPAAGEKILGGHAVVAVGYDDAAGMVMVRNSYGPTWGKGGYFLMPYAWFANMNGLVADAWTMTPKV